MHVEQHTISPPSHICTPKRKIQLLFIMYEGNIIQFELAVQSTVVCTWLLLIFLLMAGNNDSEGRKSLRAQFDDKISFFYVELPDGTILSHAIEDNEKFPVQFGREVRYQFQLLNVASCNLLY